MTEPELELGARERDLLAAYRDHHAMPGESRQRVWASLTGGSIGSGSIGSTRVTTGSRAWLVAGAGLVIAGLTLLVLGGPWRTDPERSDPERSEPDRREPTTENLAVSLGPSTPASSPELAAIRLEPTPVAAPPLVILPEPRPNRALARDRNSPAETSDPNPTLHGLARERELIEQAHAALAKGELSAALTALDEHAREFDKGVFAEEREGLDAIARCKGEDFEVGRTRALAFLARHPQAVLAARVRRTCKLSEGSVNE